MDPFETQIIFADLQTNLVASSRTVSLFELEISTTVLMNVAKALHIPVTFSLLPISTAGSLMPVLSKESTESNSLFRKTTSIFLDSITTELIKSTNRNTLIISGFSAEVVVLHSALKGLELGYQVIVPVDAIGSRSHRTEQAAINTMERAGCTISSVMSIATALAPDLSTEHGMNVMQLLDPIRSMKIGTKQSTATYRSDS